MRGKGWLARWIGYATPQRADSSSRPARQPRRRHLVSSISVSTTTCQRLPRLLINATSGSFNTGARLSDHGYCGIEAVPWLGKKRCSIDLPFAEACDVHPDKSRPRAKVLRSGGTPQDFVAQTGPSRVQQRLVDRNRQYSDRPA